MHVYSTCFISVLRLVYIYPMAVNPDQTWHSPLLCIWSAVEINIAIVCSCAPTLKCLFQRFWPKFLNSLASGYGSARRSGREDSAATAVNSRSDVTASQRSFFKAGDVVQVEAGHMDSEPSGRMAAIRRNLARPLFGDRSHGSATYENIEMKGDDAALRQGGARSQSDKIPSHQGQNIGVEFVVEQTSDVASGDYSKPSAWKPC